MKPIYVKRVIDFIHHNHPEHTRAELKALLEAEPEQFIYLLNEAIERSGSTPKCATKFIKEVQKIIKENNDMNTEKKTGFVMRLVVTAKNVWSKVTSFCSSNVKKTALTGSVLAMIVVTFLMTKTTVLLSALAALKTKGLVALFKGLFGKALALAVKGKDLVLRNVEWVWVSVQLMGQIAFTKVISLKNYIVMWFKQAWQWVTGLFKNDAEDNHQHQAA